MNQNEQDRYDAKTGEQWSQQELEQQIKDLGKEMESQLRGLGASVSDALEHGFEGRGQELGDRAAEVGRTFADMVNLGLSEAERVLDPDRKKPDRKRKAYDYTRRASDGKTEAGNYARSAFARQEGPEAALRSSARKRFGAGLTMCILGGLMAFSFFIGGLACFVSTGFVGADTVAEAVLSVTGIGLMVGGGLFTWMTAEGSHRLEASSQLKRYADTFRGMDFSMGVPLEDLAGLLQQKKRKLRKTLRDLIRRNWMTGILDEETDRLFLDPEDYRAARNMPSAAEPEPAAREPVSEETKEQKETLRLETMQRFAQVLEHQQQIMRDPLAAEELQHMASTTRAICGWLEAHPESLPKTRRFAEYYIPTTLKLLHTYNDVQGQKGGNAETIRRDIAGILHTLNTAYDNLHDTLLSDAALDVSSEIAALEGMLASDGLTGEGVL